jgi:hypothetical protein
MRPHIKTVPRHILWAGALLAVWGFMVWNDSNAMLRWESPTLNAASLLIAYLLPWLSLGLVVWGSRGRLRITAVVVLALPLLFTIVFGPFVLLHLLSVQADGDRDASFQLLAAVPVEGGRVAIYRTNCGATCAFGIAVRQERRLPLRLLLVRDLGGYYRADEARYEALSPRTVRVSVPPYEATPGNPTRSDVYEVKPWLYFNPPANKPLERAGANPSRPSDGTSAGRSAPSR